MEHRLKTPLSPDDVERLAIGDVVYLTGEMITARDKAHIRMAEYFLGRETAAVPAGGRGRLPRGAHRARA